MATYKIITDSSCDLTTAQYEALDLTYVPLNLLHKGAQVNKVLEGTELKAFYNDIRSGEMPTTSAANPDSWARVMEPVLKEGKDVLCITFTSGMSTTYQSAVIAAGDLKEKYPHRTVNVVDSLCAALGHGLLIRYACKMRDSGYSLAQLTAWAEENRHHVCHWVTIDDLNHLKRGGRISAATAFAGAMLNIKPIIRVDEEGHLETVGKMRGRKAAIEHLARQLDSHITDTDMVFIAHGDCEDDAVKLSEIIRQKHPEIGSVEVGGIGSVIGAHTGPGVLALFFMGDRR